MVVNVQMQLAKVNSSAAFNPSSPRLPGPFALRMVGKVWQKPALSSIEYLSIVSGLWSRNDGRGNRRSAIDQSFPRPPLLFAPTETKHSLNRCIFPRQCHPVLGAGKVSNELD